MKLLWNWLTGRTVVDNLLRLEKDLQSIEQSLFALESYKVV